MKERGFWTLVAAPGLAAVSWLLIFFLLGGDRVGAKTDRVAIKLEPDSPSARLRTSSTMYATVSNALGDDLSSCGCGCVWVRETVDHAGDVGTYTSLALEPVSPYTPHVSYRDTLNNQLKYAWKSGSIWLTDTLNSGGKWTSLALAPSYPYTPCVSHHDPLGWELRYGCRGETDWAFSTVESMWAGQHGTSLALEPVPPYTPHMSWNLPHDYFDLFHGRLSGAAWISETVDSDGQVGRYNSLGLEFTPPYTPHIAYYHFDLEDLRHAWLSGTVWLTETVDSAGDVGWSTSLALDSSDSPHISYYDFTNGGLKYAWLSDTTWLSETVDSTGWPYPEGGTSLALDQTDDPYICYYDATNDDLKLAYFNGTAWIIQPIDTEGDVGAYCSLALDPLGCPHISYYDATNGDLKYAYLSPIKIHLPLTTRSYSPVPPYYYESPSLTANCSWTGVLGYVRTADGLPEANVQMRVGNWQGWRADTWTDADGKYSYMFADHPIVGDWFVQVFKGGQASSRQMWWETTANCTGAGARQEFRLDWRHR